MQKRMIHLVVVSMMALGVTSSVYAQQLEDGFYRSPEGRLMTLEQKQDDDAKKEVCMSSPRVSAEFPQWREFGGGCVDNCGTENNVCTTALTNGCDCGPKHCWNPETKKCEMN